MGFVLEILRKNDISGIRQVIKMADEIYEEMMAGKLRKDGSTPVGVSATIPI